MDLLATVARVANPENPVGCTQRAFDAARARAGHVDCLTAQQICVRLNAGRKERRSWGQWLDITLNKPASFLARSAAKSGTVKQSPPQIRVAASTALRMARNEGDYHLTQPAYRAWREQRIARIHEHLRYALPTDAQVLRAFEQSWPKAVASIRLPGRSDE